MKIIRTFAGYLSVFSFVITALLTSVEFVSFDLKFFEKEYSKYNNAESISISDNELISVTEATLSYLKGERENLIINTTISGNEREFYNDREKAHMEDVKNLFVSGVVFRNSSLAVCAAAFAVFVLCKGSVNEFRKIFFAELAFCAVAFIAVGILAVFDFNKYFTIFHEMFFDNDLWLLDPETDLLIRMVPQEFFEDAVIRIAAVFASAMIISSGAVLCVYGKRQVK